MKSVVHFTDMTTQANKNLLDKTKETVRRAGLVDTIAENDLVAIKIHFGEEGNLAFVPPPLVRTVVDMIRAKGGKPFLTDANTLYNGKRRNAVDHLATAIKNGFGYETVGAPLIIADGLKGADYVNVDVNGKHFKSVKISSAVHHADALVAISHVKGHELFGFGGALKNLGMGCGSPPGKQAMHSDLVPEVKRDKCTACGTCFDSCPAGAIEKVENNRAFIKSELCIGCGECVAFCPAKAIPINWKTDEKTIQEKTAEYAWGVVKPKKQKKAFLNYVMNVTPDCDCAPWNDVPLVPNLGILGSKDPVAIDRASLDIVNEAPVIANSVLGNRDQCEDKFKAVHNRDSSPIIEHGQQLGMGSKEYLLKSFWLRQSKAAE